MMNLTAWGGAGWDPDTDPAPVKYLVAENGVFRIFTTPVGRFQLPWPEPAPDTIIPADTTQAQVALTVPRIPQVVLDAITQLFRAAQPNEYLIQVYWHRLHQWWMIETPPQQATPTSVELVLPSGWHPRYDPQDPTLPRVLQIHSHGALPAFFSATDNADEVACGLYAVMGECHTERPTLQVRAGMAGQFLPLPIDHVFAVSADVAGLWTPIREEETFHGTPSTAYPVSLQQSLPQAD